MNNAAAYTDQPDRDDTGLVTVYENGDSEQNQKREAHLKAAVGADGWAFVAAEDAPLGVQLYPTISPEYAPKFTLATVSTVRGPYGTRVVWTYEDGDTRTFDLGEIVACKF